MTVTDSQLRTATASIALTVKTPPPFVTIRTIQANKPSTYATQTVTTSGIVIGVKSNGFYLEAKNADTNPVTPEGILVYTGSTTLPSFVQVGAEVQVTGTVNTYPTTGLTPGNGDRRAADVYAAVDGQSAACADADYGGDGFACGWRSSSSRGLRGCGWRSIR